MFASDSIAVNGIQLYYETHGKGKPLLMLHGFTGSGHELKQRFKRLSDDYQLIIPDLRGHGQSTNPSGKFTFKQAADDVLKLLDHLHITECHAIGFSGGGCTLLHMAYHHSKKIKMMVLVSAAPYFPESTRALMREFQLDQRTTEEWEAMRQIHTQGDEQIKMLWTQARMLSENDGDMDFTSEKLAKIQSKTLVIQGDRDPLYPIELTIELYKNIPEAALWIIPNGGHVPVNEETMPEFIRYIHQFVMQ